MCAFSHEYDESVITKELVCDENHRHAIENNRILHYISSKSDDKEYNLFVI